MPGAVTVLQEEGQSFWLEGLSRELLTTGAFARHVEELAVTGATFDLRSLCQSIERGSAYEDAIERKSQEGKSAEATLFELALEDAVWAADLLRPIWQRTSGMDGWVSSALPNVPPRDPAGFLAAAKQLQSAARRPNLLVEIPGTEAGLAAVEQAIFAGIPVSVTMLFSAAQYRAAAQAYLRGLERRMAARLDLDVRSVASMHVAGWRSSIDSSPRALRNQVADAVGKEVYKAYRRLLRSPRWQRLFRAGARPQRLAWTGAGTEHLCPAITDAPFTVLVAPARTLQGLADQRLRSVFAASGADPTRAASRLAGIDVEGIALRLQEQALLWSRETWRATVDAATSKHTLLEKAG
jgi:transaldolase